MHTRAAVVEAPGEKFAIVDLEVDDPRDDEVLVRIVASGLCHTDLTLSGMLPAEMFPFVFGHEGAGVVEAVGADVTGVQVGDHVVLSFRSCRACGRCASGRVGYCENHLMLNYIGSRLDGTKAYSRDGLPVSGSFFGQSSFAEHVIAYADNVVVVDQALDLASLAPYGCGYQTGAGAVLNVLRPTGSGSGESLVVFGAGAVGLAAVAAARGAGVDTVVAVDLLPGRLAAAERLGAVTFDASKLDKEQLVAGVREATQGGPTFGVETTAVPEVVRQAVDVLGPAGQLVVLGLSLATPEFSVDAVDLLQNGKTIRGSIEGDSDPQVMIPQLVAANRSGAFDVDALLQRYAFEDINRAAEEALAGLVVKPVLVW
jgi:aryl-alcohol dehydrogenase